MPRKLSVEHQLELESLYRILTVFGRFLDRVMPDLGPAAAAGIDRAYAERDLRALRLARGDVIAMAQAATVAERRELDATLRAAAGVSLDDLSARDVQRIARIRARGRLTSTEQYYLVRERVDYIAGRADRADEYGIADASARVRGTPSAGGRVSLSAGRPNACWT